MLLNILWYKQSVV